MNDVRMTLTLQDMKKAVPEWHGVVYTAHSSPEVNLANRGPMLKTEKAPKPVAGNE